MTKLKVACLFGGCSSEYGVSLVSATSVIENLNKEKYDLILIGITESGDFYLYNGPFENIEKNEWNKEEYSKKITISSNRSDHGFIILDTKEIVKIDIAFPILHGKNGEDGRLQGLFELANIPYVGPGMLSSGLCMDKFVAHELVRLNGIEVPKSVLLNKKNREEKQEEIKNLKYPLFVKPLKAGSSFGITKVTEESKLKSAIDFALTYDNVVVVEENIDGFEVGCAILGNNELTIGEVDEIELQDGFFDFEEKYNLKTSKIHLPARIPEEERERIKKIALQIYQILNCKGFSRVDMFYTPDKRIVFNEVNTIPGCTSHSRYPSMLKEIGLPFSEVLDKLIELGLENDN